MALVQVWGMDGELKGNESRLMVRMPFLKFPSDPRIALALSPEWTSDAAGHLRWFASEEEAVEKGAKFAFPTPLYTVDHNVVAVIGSAMHAALETIGFSLDGWSATQEGFMVLPVSVTEYSTLSSQIALRGKEAFDQGFRSSGGLILTSTTEAGLAAMRGSAATKLEEQIVRSLIAHQLRQDTDSFRNTLELATIRLKEPRETLERWLQDYRSILCPVDAVGTSLVVLNRVAHKATTQAGRDISVIVTREMHVPEKPGGAFIRLLSRLPELNNYSQDAMTGEFESFLDACGHFSNGVSPINMAEVLGKTMAAEFDSSEFARVWDSLLDAVETPAKPTAKAWQLPLYVLRSRTLSLARDEWRLREPLSNRLPSAFARVQETAERVSDSAVQARVRRLFPGESQFPEDRLFAALGDESMKSIDDGIAWSPRPIQYGTLRSSGTHEADFAMTNELFLPPNERRSLKVIFSHTGYFAFVRRDWLELTLQKPVVRTLSPKHRQCLDGILDPSITQNQPRDFQLAARAWVALQAKLPIYQNSEYKEMSNRLTERAATFSRATPEVPVSARDAFDDDFESFICGRLDAFIGGSIHARLLKRWFMKSNRFIVILQPSDFRVLLHDIWPPKNRLRFGNRLQAKPKLREALAQFYVRIADLLDAVAAGALADDNCHRALRHFMSILALSQEARPEARWSFVTDEQDMKDLLVADNNFRPGADRTMDQRPS